jgi:hypothetical protein
MQLFLLDGMLMQFAKRRYTWRRKSRLMELQLQFGFGMMEHSRALVESWGGGTVILSPRDLTDDQLTRLAAGICQLPGGQVLLDPQFYLPNADHERLCGHDYWPDDYQTGTFFSGPQLARLLGKLRTLNERLGCAGFVLPGILAHEVSDDWLAIQKLVIDEARALSTDRPLIQTVALSEMAVIRSDGIGKLLDAANTAPADGYYLVCEHADGKYLVDNPIWLANVLDVAAGLKLLGKKVVLGYCNQQMLVAACAKVDAIASGTWMNVRSFPPEKFKSALDDEVRQRATWYYCANALSEYKLPFLDIAQRFGLLDAMAPTDITPSDEIRALFSGAQPTTIGLTEQAAFRHFLSSLNWQVDSAEEPTFDETVDRHNRTLDIAEALLARLNAARVSGQLRDFTNIVDVNRAALAVLIQDRGVMLRRRWSQL